MKTTIYSLNSNRSRLFSLTSLCVGLVQFLIPSNAGVIVAGSADLFSRADNAGGSHADSETLALALGAAMATTSATSSGKFGTISSANSSLLFNVVELSGVVTITGSLSSFGNPVDDSDWGVFSGGFAELSAMISVDEPYSYLLTWEGSTSTEIVSAGETNLGGAGAQIELDSVTYTVDSPGSFSHIDIGLLAAGDYSLFANTYAGGVVAGFGVERLSSATASFSLELTPVGSEVPETGSGVIAGVAMLSLATLQFLRRSNLVKILAQNPPTRH